MSILSKLASVFAKPRPQTVDNLLDKEKGLIAQAGSWVGGLQYTEEERAEAQERREIRVDQLRQGVVEFARSTLSESTERSRSRRSLADKIVNCELFLVLLAVVMFPIDEQYSRFVWLIAGSGLMFGAFSAVVLFHFGSYGIGQHVIRPIMDSKDRRAAGGEK